MLAADHLTAAIPSPLHPPLRLLERPAARPRQVLVRAKPAARVRWSAWLVGQVERLWAWGEGAQHHRMGSWLRH